MAYRKTSGAPGSTGSRGLAPEPKSHEQAQQEAQALLARFGGHIMEMLRAGGRGLEGMDDRYAESIYQRFGNGNNGVSAVINAGSNTPVMDILRQDAGGVPALMAQKYGGAAANVASRYALPAGGVMLAGKGLADITNGLYDAASEQPIL
jgi:L-fucose isomerase-like protein